MPPRAKGQYRPWRIVGIRDRPRQVTPAEAATLSAREWMAIEMLTRQQPFKAFRAEQYRHIFSRAGEGVDGERRVPGGEVGVDGPGTVWASGVDEECDACTDDFVGCTTGRGRPG